IAGCGLGGGANLRRWRLYCPDSGGDFSALKAARVYSGRGARSAALDSFHRLRADRAGAGALFRRRGVFLAGKRDCALDRAPLFASGGESWAPYRAKDTRIYGGTEYDSWAVRFSADIGRFGDHVVDDCAGL